MRGSRRGIQGRDCWQPRTCELLELLIGRFDAIHAHDCLHGLGEDLPIAIEIRLQSGWIDLHLTEPFERSLVGYQRVRKPNTCHEAGGEQRAGGQSAE